MRAAIELDDEALGRLADLVAERVAARIALHSSPAPDRWMTTKEAALYLRVSISELQRAAAVGAVPHEQDGPGARLYFRAADLDDWRRAGQPGKPRRALRARAGASKSLPS
jgi:excisionase family DNA binding protein